MKFSFVFPTIVTILAVVSAETALRRKLNDAEKESHEYAKVTVCNQRGETRLMDPELALVRYDEGLIKYGRCNNTDGRALGESSSTTDEETWSDWIHRILLSSAETALGLGESSSTTDEEGKEKPRAFLDY